MTETPEVPPICWAIESADTLFNRPSNDGSLVPLAPSEEAHLATLRHPLRRLHWLLGRWVAKQLVQEFCPIKIISTRFIAVDYEPSGAPTVSIYGKHTGISLSISHCDGWAFCAVTGDPAADEPRLHVGADIERVREERDECSALLDLLTPSERAQVRAAQDEQQAPLVTAIWCAKEAAGKALRTGLGLNPDRFVCRLKPEHGDAAADGWKPLTVSVESQTLPGWYRTLELHTNTRYAIALVMDADTPLQKPPDTVGEPLEARIWQ